MKFEIAFNRPDKNDTKSFYDYIGAKYEYRNKEDEMGGYYLEIDKLENLKTLMEKINLKLLNKTFGYTAIVTFDPAQIFLDDKI
jgi:hypothetical protein